MWNSKRLTEGEEVIEAVEYMIQVTGSHIYFTGDINQNSAHEICCCIDDFEIAMASQQQKVVYLHLCSPGGCVVSSLRLYDKIKYSTLNVVAILEGQAASGATIMMCACDQILTYPSVEIMIHELTAGTNGRYSQTTTDMAKLKTMMDKILAIYNARIKKSKDRLTIKDLEQDKYLSVEKCVQMGLIDTIIDKPMAFF